MPRTRLIDDLPPGPLRDHIMECADEMGIDWPIPVSRESKHRYRDHTIELYYEETGSVFAWKAFVMGLGTSSGMNADDALAEARRQIDKATP